eukprot:15432858-Alexandrium_andersonii.AAC.1
MPTSHKSHKLLPHSRRTLASVATHRANWRLFARTNSPPLLYSIHPPALATTRSPDSHHVRAPRRRRGGRKAPKGGKSAVVVLVVVVVVCVVGVVVVVGVVAAAAAAAVAAVAAVVAVAA